MDEKLRKLLDAMPERPPRSKLEAHAEVIRELRKKRRTYSEIAAFFREHVQLSVAPSTIHEFVKTRAQSGRQRGVRTPEDPVSGPQEVMVESPVVAAPLPSSPLTQNDVRERMRALKAQAAAPAQERPHFQFDPHEPLTLNPEPKEK